MIFIWISIGFGFGFWYGFRSTCGGTVNYKDANLCMIWKVQNVDGEEKRERDVVNTLG